MHIPKPKFATVSIFALAAAASADTLCYTSPSPAGFFQWNVPARWSVQSGGSVGAAVNRLPTTGDDVNVWGGGLAKPEQALCISSGVAAETGPFNLAHWAGGGDVTYFNIQNGGSLTNAGIVRIGYHMDGTHHGVATVQSGGEWNVGGQYFYLGQSKAANSVTVDSGGALRMLSASPAGEFRVGERDGYEGALTNAGTTAFYDLEVGTKGIGSVRNAGAMSVVRRFIVGGNADASPGTTGVGSFVNDGGTLSLPDTKNGVFVLAWSSGSSGTYVHKGGSISFPRAESGSYWPVIGRFGTGLLQVEADLVLTAWQMQLGSNPGTSGTIGIGENATLSGVKTLRAPQAVGATGRIEIASGGSFKYGALVLGAQNEKAVGTVSLGGGSLLADFDAGASNDGAPLTVGKIASDAANDGVGVIRGWGKVGFDEPEDTSKHVRIALHGLAIADGGGTKHDLDFGLFRRTSDYASDPNPSGRTNGWYAVNGGRLIYPRREPLANASLVALGDWPYAGTGVTAERPDITLVNALQLRLYASDGTALADGNYNYAMLYASDRDDIPGASLLPGSGTGEKTLGVWRLGHFSDSGDVGADPQNPVSFGTCSLRIRLDDSALSSVDWSEFSVGLYRWNGSSWSRVGKAVEDDLPYISTKAAQASYTADASDNWNVGWYCAALVRNAPFVMVIR